MKIKETCPRRAKAIWNKNRLAHGGQGQNEIKTRLRTPRKALENRKRVCARCARANVRSEKGDRRLAKEGKNKLTALAAAKTSRQIRLNQEAVNYTKRKQTIWFAFFLLLLHTTKNVAKRPPARRIGQRSREHSPTLHVMLANTPRCVDGFPTSCLPKT